MFLSPKKSGSFGTGSRSPDPQGRICLAPRAVSSWGPLNGVTPSYNDAGTIEALLAEANSALGVSEEDTSQRPPGGGGSDDDDELAGHIAEAKKALAANNDRAVVILSDCVEAVRSTIEAEARTLRQENSRLMAELQGRQRRASEEGLRPSSVTEESISVQGLAKPIITCVDDGDVPGIPQPPTELRLRYSNREGVDTGSDECLPQSEKRAARTDGPPALFRRFSLFSVNSAAMFADADKMKAQIRQSIAKPVYHVTDFYKNKGAWQAVARSQWFEQLTLIVIGLNAVWIGIDADWNKNQILAGAHPVFFVMENLFCLFFTIEWFVRFMSFRQTKDALRDVWFVFDSALVFITIVETWIITGVTAVIVATSDGVANADTLFDTDASTLRLVRLLRISRMARMARIFIVVPELMIVMKGLLAAIRSVTVTLTMLTIIIYVFGISFTSLTEGTSIYTKYFSGVLHSMNTLLLHGVFLEDIPEVWNNVGRESPVFGAIFLVFVLIASFLVVNMLIGVMVETVHVVSMVEREQLSVNFTKDKLLNMLHTSNLDADGDNVISKAEFAALLQIPEAVRAMQELGVDVVGLVDHTEYVFEKSSELSFPAFMDIVLQLRGSNKATVKDIVDLRKSMRHEIGKLVKMMRTIIPESEKYYDNAATDVYEAVQEMAHSVSLQVERSQQLEPPEFTSTKSKSGTQAWGGFDLPR